ncbi:MAG: hypothetical protein U1F57_04715 [bacterium]
MPKIGENNFDVRVMEKAIHRGDVKKSDYEKHLKGLSDDAANALEVRPGDPDFETPATPSES